MIKRDSMDFCQDRLSPPRLPPRPKRTLGGTNLREPIVEASRSISGSLDSGCFVVEFVGLGEVGDSCGISAGV